MSSIFQKHVQKNPFRDYSTVEKNHNVSLRMPLGMRTNTKSRCIPNGMLHVVVAHFFYRAIISSGIKRERIFFNTIGIFFTPHPTGFFMRQFEMRQFKMHPF